jgi:hypothetical protein
LALAASGLVVAADAPAVRDPTPQVQPVQELDEVIVEGRRVRKKRPSWDDYQQPFNFLARLVGQFVIEGSVDLHGQGNPEDLRRVAGRAHCIGFGSAPGVQCELNVLWPETRGAGGEEIPGGVSTLDPAVLLFGFEPVGERRGDIVISQSQLFDKLAGLLHFIEIALLD